MNVQISKTDLNRINAFLISCWVGVMNVTFDLGLPMWLAVLPIMSYYVWGLVELVVKIIFEAKSRPHVKPYEPSGGKVHWNPATKSMYEDEQ